MLPVRPARGAPALRAAAASWRLALRTVRPSAARLWSQRDLCVGTDAPAATGNESSDAISAGKALFELQSKKNAASLRNLHSVLDSVRTDKDVPSALHAISLFKKLYKPTRPATARKFADALIRAGVPEQGAAPLFTRDTYALQPSVAVVVDLTCHAARKLSIYAGGANDEELKTFKLYLNTIRETSFFEHGHLTTSARVALLAGYSILGDHEKGLRASQIDLAAEDMKFPSLLTEALLASLARHGDADAISRVVSSCGEGPIVSRALAQAEILRKDWEAADVQLKQLLDSADSSASSHPDLREMVAHVDRESLSLRLSEFTHWSAIPDRMETARALVSAGIANHEALEEPPAQESTETADDGADADAGK